MGDTWRWNNLFAKTTRSWATCESTCESTCECAVRATLYTTRAKQDTLWRHSHMLKMRICVYTVRQVRAPDASFTADQWASVSNKPVTIFGPSQQRTLLKLFWDQGKGQFTAWHSANTSAQLLLGHSKEWGVVTERVRILRVAKIVRHERGKPTEQRCTCSTNGWSWFLRAEMISFAVDSEVACPWAQFSGSHENLTMTMTHSGKSVQQSFVAWP